MVRRISKILKFVRKCKSLVFKHVRPFSSKFSKKTYTQCQHVVLNCLKVRFNEDYRDIEELVNEMPEIQKELNLSSVPHFTTLQKAFQRSKSIVLNLLVMLSAGLSNFNGNAGVDATGFQRGSASQHYTKRCKIRIKSQKTTFLVDTTNRTILGIHLTTGRKHDTKIAPIVIGRVLKWFRIKKLVGDKGYDDEKIRRLLRRNRVLPIIKYREFEESYRDLNKAVENLGYSQRVHNETVNSVVKRKYGDKLRSKRWFTQFRETKFKAIVHNIERSLLSLLQDFYKTKFINTFANYKLL